MTGYSLWIRRNAVNPWVKYVSRFTKQPLVAYAKELESHGWKTTITHHGCTPTPTKEG